MARCGNSLLAAGEACDNGDTLSLAGSSSTSEVEDLQSANFELDRVTIRPRLSKPGQVKARGTVQIDREASMTAYTPAKRVTVTFTTRSGLARTINWRSTHCSISPRKNISYWSNEGPFARFGQLDDCTAFKRGKLYCDGLGGPSHPTRRGRARVCTGSADPWRARPAGPPGETPGSGPTP